MKAVLSICLFVLICSFVNAQERFGNSPFLDVRFNTSSPDFSVHFLRDQEPTGMSMHWINYGFTEVLLDLSTIETVRMDEEAFLGGSTHSPHIIHNFPRFKASIRQVVTNVTYEASGHRDRDSDLFDVDEEEWNEEDIDARKGPIKGSNDTTTLFNVTAVNVLSTTGYVMLEDVAYEYAGEQQFLKNGAFKLDIALNDWPWRTKYNQSDPNLELFLQMKIGIYFNVNNSVTFNSTKGDYDLDRLRTIFIHAPDGTIEYRFDFAENCVIDNANTSAVFSKTLVQENDDANHFTLYILFPFFSAHLYYDPNLNPLLDTSSDGDDKAVTIAVAVVVPVAVLSVMLVSAIVLILVLIGVYHRLHAAEPISAAELVQF